MQIEEIRQLDAYEILREEKLPDIHADGIILRHKKSGARVMLLPCEDENKVFNIAFRTPPADSTGVAHIIEHTVLCGSEHFPLKDPFVQLVQGSLNTFLNAMTYPDKTMYPVASTNDADFRNLMHVYLDAVFFPNIYREQNIFRQEGWHYELESEEAPLTLNGVVYNEMKGVFSSADDVLERAGMDALFPDTAYGVESGGDPDVIPELTYQQYLDFHRKYYHPSNSYIFLYGKLDMADALSFIDREYLSGFDVLAVDSGIRAQEPFGEERFITRDYPVSDDEDVENNSYLSWNVVAGDPLDVQEMIALDILDYALLSAPGAPVRQALLDEGIGLDVYGGLSDGILQPYFGVTAKNASASDADRFRSVIRHTLQEQADGKLDHTSLRAGLHSMEFSFREADYGQTPKGLYYSIYALETWLYNDDVPFAWLKQLDAYHALGELVDTGYFEKLISEKLLKSTHSAMVVLNPEKGLAAKREKALQEKLAQVKSAMSKEEIEACIRETKALKEWQLLEDSPEALATLPVLQRSDLRREVLPLSNEEAQCSVTLRDGRSAGLPVVFHDAQCSGIGYLELLFNAKRVPEELVPYIGLLKAVLMNVDTASYTYKELTNAVNMQTGGISCVITTTDLAQDPQAYRALFCVRMKALVTEMEQGGELLGEILCTSVFTDGKRIREILSQTRSRLQVSLQQSGHMAAATRAAAATSPENAFSDIVGGIAFYRFIKDLEEHAEEKQEEIAASLGKLASLLFRPDNVTVSYTSGKEDRDGIAAAVGKALASPAEGSILPDEHSIPPYGRENVGFTTPGQVQYVAMSGSFAASGIPYTGTMALFRQLMTYDYLWQNIRVTGGAYGCGANIRRNGRGLFTSYRDPHLKRTAEIFRSAPAYLREFAADDKTMTRFVIGTFSTLDTPLTPASFGLTSMREYLRGVTEEMRQELRDAVLYATEEDIRGLADAVQALVDDSCLCVVGGEETVKKDAELFDRVEVLL